MFRKLIRAFSPNPLDQLLKRAKAKGSRRFLIAWNRGLGDIALGLYAIVHRIREFIPEAEVTFLIRENLKEGFELFKGVKYIVAPSWKRGQPYDVKSTLKELGITPETFEEIIEKPDPSYWVKWQRGKLVPKLEWNSANDALYKKFGLDESYTYIATQVQAETNYGLWRNWPMSYWFSFLEKLQEKKNFRVLLFGYGSEPKIPFDNVIDLRGKTSLFEVLSIVKNLSSYLIVPDSGILSMVYYLNASFPIHIFSFWGDPRHGILKQNVSSPNPLLEHEPLIGKKRDLSSVTVEYVLSRLEKAEKERPSAILKQVKNFAIPRKQPEENKAPLKPFNVDVPQKEDALLGRDLLKKGKAACVILAGGHGSRLGFNGPKGCFPISVVKRKSLFQIFAEKVKAAQKQIGRALDLAIMCSESNVKETREFFIRENYFGLHEESVHFFCQKELPLTEISGKWLLNKEGKIATGPDGNGSFYRSFYETLFPSFQKKGIEHLFVLPVDNPLADPFSASFLGYHVKKQNEVSSIVVPFENVHDKMGIWVEKNQKPAVCEYVHFNLKEIASLLEREKVYANINLFLLSFSFIERAAQREDFPYIQAEKEYEGKKVLKWERFIFDAFPWADRIGLIAFAKKDCYAPLKTAASVLEVQKALKLKDVAILNEITQKTAPSLNLELDLSFHYPTDEFLQKWRGKELSFEKDAYLE
jgi:UDP-N-acetylglucosamine/UDP-N-acetylgalactosamine diphosphorylase